MQELEERTSWLADVGDCRFLRLVRMQLCVSVTAGAKERVIVDQRVVAANENSEHPRHGLDVLVLGVEVRPFGELPRSDLVEQREQQVVVSLSGISQRRVGRLNGRIRLTGAPSTRGEMSLQRICQVVECGAQAG